MDSGGWFCANRNILIRESKNDFKRIKKASELKSYSLIKANGVAVCPLRQRFSKVGDYIEFDLVFPVLDPLPEFIDVVEGCNDSCFRLEGVCLNKELAFEIATYYQAFEDYENGKTDSALAAFEKIVELYDTTNTMYDFALTNIPGLYEHIGDKANAELWYRKILASEIITNDYRLDNSENSFANYKHHAAVRLASICKNSAKYTEALDFTWQADTLYPFNDTSVVLKSQKKALLLYDKINLYQSLKKYDDALFCGINGIINEETPHLYDRHSALLVDIIKKQKEYKKYVKAFNAALLKLKVSEEDNIVTGSFKFEGMEYKLSIDKNYIVLAVDPKTKQTRKATIQDKDQNFFIERIKLSDFYIKLTGK